MTQASSLKAITILNFQFNPLNFSLMKHFMQFSNSFFELCPIVAVISTEEVKIGIFSGLHFLTFLSPPIYFAKNNNKLNFR